MLIASFYLARSFGSVITELGAFGLCGIVCKCTPSFEAGTAAASLPPSPPSAASFSAGAAAFGSPAGDAGASASLAGALSWPTGDPPAGTGAAAAGASLDTGFAAGLEASPAAASSFASPSS